MMITLYTWPTPNGKKISILLEELGLDYTAVAIDIGAGDQFSPSFLKISPNNKIPAIQDSEGPDGKPISLFESGAIMVYLAGKTGKLMGSTDREKYEVLQWLMFQMGGLGPMLGQAHHFRLYAPETLPYAVDRYTKEAHRLYGVLDKALKGNGFLAAGQYTIADIACWPWVASHKNQGVTLDQYPNVLSWFNKIAARPAVEKGSALLAELRRPSYTPEEKERLFALGTPKTSL